MILITAFTSRRTNIFRHLLKVALKGTHQCDFRMLGRASGSQLRLTTHVNISHMADQGVKDICTYSCVRAKLRGLSCHIIAEGAITLPVTLSGGVLFAS